jgi:hypothetical protein
VKLLERDRQLMHYACSRALDSIATEIEAFKEHWIGGKTTRGYGPHVRGLRRTRQRIVKLRERLSKPSEDPR